MYQIDAMVGVDFATGTTEHIHLLAFDLHITFYQYDSFMTLIRVVR
jgi:hypothetical protein